MKIAIYAGDIPSTTFIERLIKGLATAGNEVYAFGKQKQKVVYSPNIKVIAYHNSLSKGWMFIKYYTLLLFSRPKQLGRLKQILKAEDKPHYIHKLSISMPVLYYKPDVFHVQWAKAIKDWLWVKEFGMKMVLSLRGTHINYSPITVSGLADMYRKTFPNVDGFHAVSDAIGAKAVVYGARNIKTIYSGLSTDEYQFKLKEHKSDRINILSVGRLHWVKGYNYAIDAMHILKDKGINFHYTIVGGKVGEEALFNIADMELQQYISFIEYVPHAELKDFMHAADICVLPSVEEGIANVALEAMAYGTIVIATDCGGMTEAIIDEENGFIVPIRDSEALAAKIIEVNALNEERKNTIKINAQRIVTEKFRADRMIQEMTELYQTAQV